MQLACPYCKGNTSFQRKKVGIGKEQTAIILECESCLRKFATRWGLLEIIESKELDIESLLKNIKI